MFGANNQELPEGKNYITFGIHNVEIVSLSMTDDNQNFDLELKNVGAEDSDSSNFRFFMNGDDKAKNSQMRRFYEIVEAVDPALTKIAAASLPEYIALLAPKMKGKQYIQKFRGQQNAADSPYWARIPNSMKNKRNPEPTIACAIGTEPPFTFDKSNEWDYRPFQGAAATVDMSSASDSADVDAEWED